MPKDLICPYCKSSLSFKFLSENSWGIAKCDCDEYPVLEAIVYLIKDDYMLNRRVVSLLKDRKCFMATWKCLRGSAKTHRTIVFVFYLLKKYFKIKFPLPLLLNFLRVVGPSRSWFEYLLKRTKRDDIHIAIKLTQKYRAGSSLFLDLGFGIGSLLDLLLKKRLDPPAKYVGIDKSFLSLLVARLNFSEKYPLLLCCDIESRLPFKDSSAGSVLLLDVFGHIYNKPNLISEVCRVLKKQGRFYIVNVYPTTPKTYLWGYGVKPKSLLLLLRKDFKNMKFLKNSLGKKGRLQYFSPNGKFSQGYSVVSFKK